MEAEKKAPSTKIQAPGKYQIPNCKIQKNPKIQSKAELQIRENPFVRAGEWKCPQFA
jgi:hypothetical protein